MHFQSASFVLCVCFVSAVADAATWHVATNGSDAAAGTSWAAAKLTIQAAIDAAAASDTVLVSNGVYQTGGRVALGSSLTNRVLIDKPITVQSVNGPAVTTIRGNKPTGDAAVRCVWMTGGASLVGFTLTNGSTRVDFGVDGNGGGLWAQSTSAVVNNCTLTGNSASSDGGGASGGTLNNCTLSGNSANIGGGSYSAVVNNCTLTGNSASSDGGGDYFGTLNNCIVYFNTAPNGSNYLSSTITYTCTTPLPGGTGNITNAPLFVATNDFRLAVGSPGINAGDNALAVGATDLAGNPRILGGRVDMGAFEALLRASVSNADGPITTVDTSFAIPNPSIIRVGGVTGAVAGLRVTLNGLSHTFPDDLDIFLVSPGGSGTQGVKLMSDAGLNFALTNAILTFDDAADAFLPDSTPIPNGVYRPTDYNSDTPFAFTFVTNLASLITNDVNGDWRLFIFDDFAGDTGSLTSWSLEFEWFVDPTNHFVNLANPTPASPYATWATAATNIQDAIDAATAGDTVLVSNGVYQTGGRVASGSALTNRVLIDKPITVRSVNGPAVTTIRGNKPIGNAAVRCVWMSDGATLAGFTLTNGATRASGDFDTERSGGGAWAQSTDAVVSNCTLTGNSASSRGGGVLQGTLNNCTLTGNSAGFGGGAFQGTLNNCTLTGNSADEGGGAYQGTLINCTLSGNSASSQGGGADEGTLNNCMLSGNSANIGGGANNGTLNHCTLIGNSADFGGGARFSTLNNCTLTGNSATNSGGGAWFSTLNNCIVYFNTAPSDANDFGGAINTTCTTPLPAGTGNITNDPLFVSLATTNLQLAANSPCINVGNNANAPGATDLIGNPRIALGTVDMGAYEYDGSADQDTDGFTDAEEYIADTQPTNAASFFPKFLLTHAPAGQTALVIEPTSTGRVYGVFANTNLLQTPQTWTLIPPEQTGTASALTLTITNALPAANYRTGVRLP